MLKKTALIVGLMALPMTSMAITSLPFGKKYDETLLDKAIHSNTHDLIALIEQTTDIKVAQVRNELDKELPRTDWENSPLIEKLSKANVPQIVQDYVCDTHRTSGLMVPSDDPDIKVPRNTIFINEFSDSYTLIHEYMHSLFNLQHSGGHVPLSQDEIYRALHTTEFRMDKVMHDFSLLSLPQWRQDVISALEDSVDVMIRGVTQASCEEVLIERTLARLITPGTPPYNEARQKMGLDYAQSFATMIDMDFNAQADYVGFVVAEIKTMEGIPDKERTADQQRLDAIKKRLLDYRDEVVKLEAYK